MGEGRVRWILRLLVGMRGFWGFSLGMNEVFWERVGLDCFKTILHFIFLELFGFKGSDDFTNYDRTVNEQNTSIKNEISYFSSTIKQPNPNFSYKLSYISLKS
jgi:hypothetical protein